MPAELYLGTMDGVVICSWQAGTWQVVQHVLDGQEITSLSGGADSLLAGTPRGVWRSVDGGQSWSEANDGLEICHIRSLAHHPEMPGLVFAGTEPAGIFISFDDGRNWSSRPEVSELRERQHWYLPYSPEAGCVRGFAFFELRAYAAVEVGGVLVSSDGGETWRLLQAGQSVRGRVPHWVSIHPDVHTLLTHPASPDLIYAPTGDGFYRSVDSGRTWRRLHAGYSRASWVDPRDIEHIILGTAESVDRNGTIVVSLDGGKTWDAGANGLAVPWKRHHVDQFLPAGEQLLGILSNGELIGAPLDQVSLQWSALLPEVKGVRAAAYLQKTTLV